MIATADEATELPTSVSLCSCPPLKNACVPCLSSSSRWRRLPDVIKKTTPSLGNLAEGHAHGQVRHGDADGPDVCRWGLRTCMANVRPEGMRQVSTFLPCRQRPLSRSHQKLEHQETVPATTDATARCALLVTSPQQLQSCTMVCIHSFAVACSCSPLRHRAR